GDRPALFHPRCGIALQYMYAFVYNAFLSGAEGSLMGAICRAGASFLSSSFPVLKKRISTIAKIALIVLTLFSSFPKNLAAAGGENRPSPHLPDCWNSVTDYFQNEGCIVSIKRSSNTFLENQQDP